MGRFADKSREYRMAVHLKAGENPSAAARKAGYPESVVRTRAAKIARSDGVLTCLLEMESKLAPGTLGRLAKARIQEKLVNPPKEAKTALGYFRTALEIDGMIGGPSELHLHQHATLPPKVQEMLEAKMLEIMGMQKTEVLDATILSQRAASEGQNQENHDGIQVGELTFGFQDRAISQVAGPGDSHLAITGET